VVDASLRSLEDEGKSAKYLNDSKRFLDRMSDFWGKDRQVTEITSVMVKESRVSLMEDDKDELRKRTDSEPGSRP